MARATVTLFDRWRLQDREACVLLGDMAPRTWARWKKGEIKTISRDLRYRLALFISIHKGIRYLFTDADRGYQWIRRPNDVFGGDSALDIMMRGDIVDLLRVRDYLASERGL